VSTAVIVEPEILGEAPPGRRRLPVLLALVVVVALGAGAAWYLLLREPGPDLSDVDGEIVAVEPMTTTVGEASMHHARVAMAVVLAHGEDPLVVPPRVPLLQDALLRELARMDGPEVRSARGSDALREALTAEAKEIWGENVVRRVVLTELLVN
jgi:flagellar basal body-associated protein FliL